MGGGFRPGSLICPLRKSSWGFGLQRKSALRVRHGIGGNPGPGLRK